MALIFCLAACRAGDPAVPPAASLSPAGSPPLAGSASPAARLPTLTPFPPEPTRALTPLSTALATAAAPTLPPLLATGSAAISPSNAGRLAVLETVTFEPWELVTALAWSPDGRTLAVAAGDSIYLVTIPGLARTAAHRTGCLTHSLAFSPDGTWLASAGHDGNLRLWQANSLAAAPEAAPALVLEAHRKGANMVVFSPQFGRIDGALGRLLASGGNDAVARFWDFQSGENIGLMVGGTFAVPSIAFLPDGALLAVTNGDRIRLREVGSERIAGTFAADAPLYSLAVSPDGGRIVAGGSDNRIRVWDVDAAYRTGQEQYPDAQILTGHFGRADTYRALVWQVVYSPAGDLLVSAGGDGALALWSAADLNLAARFPAHTGGATSLAFHPEARWLATGGLDGQVRVWGALP